MTDKIEIKSASNIGAIEMIRKIMKGEIKPSEYNINIQNEKMAFWSMLNYRTESLSIRYNSILVELEFLVGCDFKLVVKPENILACSYNETYKIFSITIILDPTDHYKKLFSGFFDQEDLI